MIKPTSKQNRESKKDKVKNILIFVLFNFLVLSLIIIFFFYTLSHLAPNLAPKQEFCDYDSCSQEATSGKWNYSGSACFDGNNSDCQDFLRFWRACQEYKQRIGIC
jgi:hypothetical protein